MITDNTINVRDLNAGHDDVVIRRIFYTRPLSWILLLLFDRNDIYLVRAREVSRMFYKAVKDC